MIIKSFPKTNIPVTICNHRYGAKMTFTEQSDARFLPNAYNIEKLGFKNNIRLGIFTSGNDDDMSGIGDTERTGLVRHDIYSFTDFWVNPNTGAYEQIPDYYSTTWTNAGASIFANAVVGQPKPTGLGITANRYPNHGQQMFNVSNGSFGYDEVNSVIGSSDLSELYRAIEFQKNKLRLYVDRTPSTASFRNGQTGMAIPALSKYIGQKNSVYSASIGSNVDTWYGNGLGFTSTIEANDRKRLSSYPNSSRYWDSIVSNPESRKILVDPWLTTQLQHTISNSGWWRDFIHWHQLTGNNIGYFDQWLALVRSAAGNNFIHTCSNGEALEYFMIREITKKVSAVDRFGEIIIVTDIVDKYKSDFINGISTDIPLDTLNIPLSIEIDLTGTSLANKSIISNYGKIVNLGSNKFIVEIPFNNKEFFQSISLKEGLGGYFDISVPTGSVSGNTVTTNIPTRAVQFKEDGTVIRSNELKTSHEFPGASSGQIGIISEFGQTKLI